MGQGRRSWSIRGLHHVAFAQGPGTLTPDRLCDVLGLEVSHQETGPGFVERMLPAGPSFVQVLESNGEGLVRRFVEARGPALHHVAFEVDSLYAALEDMKDRGVRLVDEEPRAGGMGTKIAFVHPSVFGGLLVELVEDENR